MSNFDTVPLWLAIPIAGFVMLGATLTLIGAYGFLRLGRFYDRLHAPTLATSWGAGGVILASLLLASHLQNRIVLHEIVVGIAMMVTIPVTLMLLGRAALHRDRSEGSPNLPELLNPPASEEPK
jgi:multicomponent K+:H+ antiporter subunit G